MHFLHKLKEIGQVLIQEEPCNLDLSKAILEYKDLLHRLSPYDPSNEKFLADVNSTGGRAIGTNWAALCLEDLLRTKTFVRGVYEAIQSSLKNSSDPIKLLYAGTGPYATLLLPILPFFTPKQLQLGLLEINPVSFEMVKALFKKTSLSSFVEDYFCEDAVTFKFPDSLEYDIILSETMQNGLRDEPQVAISANLLRQFPNAILIPERISISAGYYTSLRARPENVENARFILIKELFALDKATALAINNQNEFETITFDCKKEDWSGYQYCSIFTEIRIFGKNELLTNQSGLTVPIFLFQLEPEEPDVKSITFQYEMGARPGLKTTYHHS